MLYDSLIKIGTREIGLDRPAYFIADIGASHDGDLERAKALVWQAKEAGADAAKFQHFLAKDIVSDEGFRALGGQVSHQAGWKKSVYQVYEQYEAPRDWTPHLIETCKAADIDFMTTPYDFAAIDIFAKVVPAFKVGSGDITWTDAVAHIAKKGKPVFLATGASSMSDVERAVEAVLAHNRQIVLMQCNTNYTGDLENFRYVNLNVLKAYALRYPDMVLGLSDHTPGHATVLGAVALGARIIEKHFTDDNNREGPDHPFSMTPQSWAEMVYRSRELEAALGDGIKRIEENEKQTAIVQRRCLRLTRDVKAGDVLTAEDLKALRPAPEGALAPYETDKITGQLMTVDRLRGDALTLADIRM